MKERIQKILASRGVASRRACEELIIAGRVSCNGTVCTLGQTADPDIDVLLVNGCPIPVLQKPLYLMLHKPKGYVTTMSDEKGRKNVSELVVDCPQRVYPVGRLDMDSEGLLIMTNDGDFANILMHPASEVEKVYMAKLKGIIKGEHINTLKDGVKLDDQVVKPSRVKLKKVDPKTNTCMVQITIHEGKNHQVKRMFESVGFEVLKLKREKEAFFDLKDLQSGEFRKLTPKEVAKVYGLQK